MENKEEKGIFVRVYNWFKNLTVRGLLGAILVFFIILVILMSASYLPSVMGRISSSLSAALYSVFVPAESATVTADKKIINSGEDFTINFKKGGTTTNGIFTVSYPCSSNADLVSVEAAGLKKINCDTPYYLLDNETSIKIRPTTQDSVVRLVLDASFENNDTQKTEKIGVVRVTVKNDSAGTTVVPATTTPAVTVSTSTTPAATPTYTAPTYTAPAVVQPVYYGKPDLAVRILQVGLLNSATNLITPQSQFTYSDMVGIKFEVRNDGDANTGSWYFTASLPSISTPTYNSNAQISLKPGESIIFTLGFSNLTNQNVSIITINVDPTNIVAESTEANNIVTSTITNLSYNSNYYYNNNSNTGCYINGNFTYNCNNNYNYNNGTLTASCYPSNVSPQTGQTISWNPTVSGGNGSYTYYWTGTDNLSSYSQYPNITYYNAGYKTANLTVTSGGYSTTATCSTSVGGNYNNNGYYDSYGNWINYNNNNGYYDSYGNWINYNNNNSYGDLGVTCYGSPSNISSGDRVHWYANAFGGNGNYSYSWSGTNGLDSSSQNPSKTYSSSGKKDALVTVRSGGYYVSYTCSIYVNN